MSNNNSIDKMAAQFTSMEELQAYCDAQFKTITTLNTKINELTKAVEDLSKRASALLRENAALKVNAPKDEGKFAVSDEEAACVIQIAMIKNTAMDRELTMDETKRLEIYVKTLSIVRGKDVGKKEKDELSKLSNDDLLKAMDSIVKDPQ